MIRPNRWIGRWIGASLRTERCVRGFVVIRDVSPNDSTKVSLPEHNDVVETLPSDRADQPFDISILPWGSRRRRPVTDAHAFEASGHDLTIDRIAVADQITRSFSPGKCIGDLSSDPLRRRMRRDTER
jgi:hypothetical protein